VHAVHGSSGGRVVQRRINLSACCPWKFRREGGSMLRDEREPTDGRKNCRGRLIGRSACSVFVREYKCMFQTVCSLVVVDGEAGERTRRAWMDRRI
jgi:hypothetical protein